MTDSAKPNRIWDIFYIVLAAGVGTFFGVIVSSKEKLDVNDATIASQLSSISSQFAGMSVKVGNIEVSLAELKADMKGMPSRAEFVTLNKQVDSNTDRVSELERAVYKSSRQ